MKNKRLCLKSIKLYKSLKLNRVQHNIVIDNDTIGANIKLLLYESLGMIPCLKTNLRPSRIGWKRPKNPTRLGPSLLWMMARNFLSAIVIYAMLTNKPIKYSIKIIKNIYIEIPLRI